MLSNRVANEQLRGGHRRFDQLLQEHRHCAQKFPTKTLRLSLYINLRRRSQFDAYVSVLGRRIGSLRACRFDRISSASRILSNVHQQEDRPEEDHTDDERCQKAKDTARYRTADAASRSATDNAPDQSGDQDQKYCDVREQLE